jgi:xylulokinase
VPPGEPVGPVTRAASERSGLAAGTPVFVAGHDHAVGSWAAGVRHPGDVADSVGTAEALVRVLAHPVDQKAALACGMSMTRTVTGEYGSLLAGSASSGSFVRWFSDTHLGGHDPADLLPNAVGIEPSGVILLPYLRGRQSPSPDPDARVRVLDAAGRVLDPASCRSERLALAVFEALALQLRWMDAEQRRLAADAALSTLVVLGGPGAQSPAALAVKATVLGARLAVVTVAEPVACGAALLAASRLGFTVPPLPRRAVEPAPGLGGRYDSRYTAFVAAASASPQGEQ